MVGMTCECASSAAATHVEAEGTYAHGIELGREAHQVAAAMGTAQAMVQQGRAITCMPRWWLVIVHHHLVAV